MEPPIINILATKSQKDLATLQDQAVEAVRDAVPDAVLHGGPAIWRCYGGKRFSADLDFYSRAKNLPDALYPGLAARRLNLIKSRETANSVYAVISDDNTEVKLEISRRAVHGVPRPYVKADSSRISILTLTPEALMLEKMDAYTSRNFSRDLYDLYHLCNLTDNASVKSKARLFLKDIPAPQDGTKQVLDSLVYGGGKPDFKEMVEYLQRWAG